MSVGRWFRALFAKPERIDDGGNPEADAALQEDFGVPDAGEAELKSIAEGGTGGAEGLVQPSGAASEGAETALEDLESEEAPADSDP